MHRRQTDQIIKDLGKKLVFIVGPRQVGKTWLAREIGKQFDHTAYLNYDSIEHMEIIRSRTWPRSTDLLILDELHKMPKWKNFLKGIYDTKPESMSILVTGSARLDAFRQGGDSMAGRFFSHRLLPFSPAELSEQDKKYPLEHFITRGGFPEPFLSQSNTEAQRWRKQYADGLIRTDILDLGMANNLRCMQLLFEMLRTRVGSQVSFASLARDLSVSPTTVSKYVGIMEALYMVFRVTPWSRNIARSMLKEPKIYFYDTGMVRGNEGARFENLVALCLLKSVLARQDLLGQEAGLHYLRTKEGREADFCITAGSGVELVVEAKLSDTDPSPGLRYFCNKYGFPGVQAVLYPDNEKSIGKIEIMAAERFLTGLML